MLNAPLASLHLIQNCPVAFAGNTMKMLTGSWILPLFAALAAAAPAPRFSLYTAAAATGSFAPTSTGSSAEFILSSVVSSHMASVVPSLFSSDSAVAYTLPPSLPVVPIRSSQVTGATSHGPFSGTPTIVGAPQYGPAAASIGTLPPNPTATYYNTNGLLTQEEPAPYTPAGGLGTNGTLPRYMVESDFDYMSIVSRCFSSLMQ